MYITHTLVTTNTSHHYNYNYHYNYYFNYNYHLAENTGRINTDEFSGPIMANGY